MVSGYSHAELILLKVSLGDLGWQKGHVSPPPANKSDYRFVSEWGSFFCQLVPSGFFFLFFWSVQMMVPPSLLPAKTSWLRPCVYSTFWEQYGSSFFYKLGWYYKSLFKAAGAQNQKIIQQRSIENQEGQFRNRHVTVIVSIWFSMEHHWMVITSFWLSNDDMTSIVDLLVVVGVAVEGRGVSAEDVLQPAVGQWPSIRATDHHQAILTRVHPLIGSSGQEKIQELHRNIIYSQYSFFTWSFTYLFAEKFFFFF